MTYQDIQDKCGVGTIVIEVLCHYEIITVIGYDEVYAELNGVQFPQSLDSKVFENYEILEECVGESATPWKFDFGETCIEYVSGWSTFEPECKCVSPAAHENDCKWMIWNKERAK
jgi:hypothetical protein